MYHPIDYIDSKEKYNPYDFLYELQSVIFLGGSYEDGHCWIEVNANGVWYSCDDNKIIPLNHYSISREVIGFIYKRVNK